MRGVCVACAWRVQVREASERAAFEARAAGEAKAGERERALGAAHAEALQEVRRQLELAERSPHAAFAPSSPHPLRTPPCVHSQVRRQLELAERELSEERRLRQAIELAAKHGAAEAHQEQVKPAP